MSAPIPDPWTALWQRTGDRPSPTAPAAWRAAIAADPWLRRAVVVVDLLLSDGARVRVSTVPVDAVRAGDSRWVLGALTDEPEIVDSYEPDGAGGSGDRQIAIEIRGDALDAQARLADLRSFVGLAEVSVLVPGMAWPDRRVVLVGTWGEIRVGVGQDGAGDAAAWAVSGSVSDPRALLDSAIGSVVDATAWPDPFEGSIGEVYPIAWGRAVVECVRLEATATRPLYAVVEGHGWTVDAVWSRVGEDDQELAPADYAVSEVVDGRGVAVTVVQTDPGVVVYGDGSRLFARVYRSGQTDPGVVDVFADAIARWGPGDLLHRDAWAEAKRGGHLPAAPVINTRVGLVDWLSGGVFADWPQVKTAWIGGGIAPIVTDYRSEPVADLVVGASLWARLADPSEDDRVYNAFRVRYAYDARLDAFTGLAEAEAASNATCAASEQLIRGRREYPTIDGVSIPDSTAAGVVLDWLVSHLTSPTWVVTYSGPRSLYFERMIGQTVRLTDRALGWVQVRATVESLALGAATTTITLRAWSGPLRRTR